MNNICPSSEQCPIFNGLLSDKETTAKYYRMNYCEAGEEKWNSCKRFIAKKTYGKCPPDLLPNSMKTIEEIGTFYKLN